MDDAEAERMEAEVLDDLASAFVDELEGDAWERLLVMLAATGGEPVVAEMDVEGITDDERVEKAFAPERVGPILPVLAKACDALLSLRGLDTERVLGGTFVRGEGFAFVPGVVKTPSARITKEIVDRAHAKNAAFTESVGMKGGVSLAFDARALEVTIRSDGGGTRVPAVLLATWEEETRNFSWVGRNPGVPDPLRSAAAALIDEILERDVWEISTPRFQTDADGAFAAAAWVLDRADGRALLVLDREEDGELARGFVLVRQVEP